MKQNSDPDASTDIQDWTIVVAQADEQNKLDPMYAPYMACSPDGLLIRDKLGYEYKTKDGWPVPESNTSLLACEYLQCQTSLFFCGPDIADAWIIVYNRLDTNETKAFIIFPDEQLWRCGLKIPFTHFVDKVLVDAQTLFDLHLIQDVIFEDFVNKHRYKPVEHGYKEHMLQALKNSMSKHVIELPFVD